MVLNNNIQLNSTTKTSKRPRRIQSRYSQTTLVGLSALIDIYNFGTSQVRARGEVADEMVYTEGFHQTTSPF